MLSNLKTGTKVLAQAAVAVALATVIFSVGYLGVRQLRALVEDLSTVQLPSVQHLDRLQLGVERVMYGLQGLNNRRMMDDRLRADLWQQTKTGLEEAEQALAAYGQLPKNREEEAAARELMPTWSSWKALLLQATDVQKEKERLTETGAVLTDERVAALDAKSLGLLLQTRDSSTAVENDLRQLAALANDHAEEDLARAAAAGRLAITVMIVAMLLGALALIVMGVAVSRNIGTSLAKLVAEAQRLTDGAVSGKLATRGDPTLFGAEFRPVVVGFNATMEALVRALDAANTRAQYLDRIPTPVMAVDRDMKVKFINAHGARAVGRSQEACVGVRCSDLFKTAHCNTPNCCVAKAIQMDAVFTDDTVARLPGGELPIRYTGATLKDDKQVTIGAIEYAVDISEEKCAVSEVEGLVRAFVDGHLDARGKPEQYHIAGFRNVVQGINDALAAILTPVNHAMGVLGRLADRDLQARDESESRGDHAKLRDALNQTAAALHDALVQVADATDQVAASATQIAEGSQAVSQGASEQASAIEETSSNLEEMTGMTKQNAESAAQANQLAQAMRGSADKGKAAMDQMLGAMGKIRTASETTSQIIRDINEISFQTNLLALNAAVEAARAGDAGRGFAVVAEEVRALAQRSKEAASKTEALIGESVRLTGEGECVTREVSTSLGEIVSSVSKVTGLVEEIAASSKEQARGLEQLNKAVSQMDQVVQQNVANAEESSSAAEELAGQAEQLATMVGQYKLGRDAGARPGTRRPAGPPAGPARLPRHSQSTGLGLSASAKDF